LEYHADEALGAGSSF